MTRFGRAGAGPVPVRNPNGNITKRNPNGTTHDNITDCGRGRAQGPPLQSKRKNINL